MLVVDVGSIENGISPGFSSERLVSVTGDWLYRLSCKKNVCTGYPDTPSEV